MQKVFITCAHSPHGIPLPQLVQEVRTMENLLQPLKARGLLEVLSNRAANLEDLFQTFVDESHIRIFHYAGHADETSLFLEEKGGIKGIAELLGLNNLNKDPENALKLVFLNGCSSKGQVESLHHAGVAAVIATSRSIEDRAAFQFAEQFYRTWTTEGKSLRAAFETACARVHALDGAENRGFVTDFNFDEDQPFQQSIPWGLYLNPNSKGSESVENWILNQRPQLPAMLLGAVKPHISQSLRSLVHEFRKMDGEALRLMQNERKDPLFVLIERLPWIIGTHLRRLFAADPGHTMSDPGIERLKELIAAYTGLTRFISYLTLSMLWEVRDGQHLPFSIFPAEEESDASDFIYRTRIYWGLLTSAPFDDPLGLGVEIEGLLKKVSDDQDLRSGYLILEEWKQALMESPARFGELTASRAAEKPEGLKTLVLEAEAIYARFLHASLFLTRYKLLSVRSVVVDKIRKLEIIRPFSHYTISLHAAFSQLQTSLTERESATDTNCLLLIRRDQSEDPFADSVNLSPFYLDRSSFIQRSTNDYPTIFVLDYYRRKDFDKEFVFQYIDTDINHTYTFEKDNQLVVDAYGATLPDHLETDGSVMLRFEQVYNQLQQLEQDFPMGSSQTVQ